jgi:hypothetical protein
VRESANPCECGCDYIVAEKIRYGYFMRCHSCGRKGQLSAIKHWAVKAWNDGKTLQDERTLSHYPVLPEVKP